VIVPHVGAHVEIDHQRAAGSTERPRERGRGAAEPRRHQRARAHEAERRAPHRGRDVAALTPDFFELAKNGTCGVDVGFLSGLDLYPGIPASELHAECVRDVT